MMNGARLLSCTHIFPHNMEDVRQSVKPLCLVCLSRLPLLPEDAFFTIIFFSFYDMILSQPLVLSH